MRRPLFHAAVIFTAALATTGCASLGIESGTDAQQPAPAKAAETNTDTPYAGMIAKLPHDLDGEIRRAQLLRTQGDFKGAIKALSQLMLVAADDPRIVGEYGKVLTQEGRTDDALAFLGRAIELQPDNWTFYSAEGVAFDQKGERTKAENAYKHALSLKPGNPGVLNNYAMSQMQAGHLDRAEQLLHEAAAHGGDYPKIANNLAMITAMRGKSAVAPSPESAVKPVSVRAIASAPAPAAAKLAHAAAPRSLLHKPATKRAPQVVMQKLPYDPLAGKHYGKAASHAVAAATPKTPEQHLAQVEPAPEKTAPPREASIKPAPALRTAADIY